MAGGACIDDSRKQNHCEIEKRRRDKMNYYITELASVIPAFSNNQSKLDKLTVLRMAVQHVKSLRSSLCSFSSFHLRPSFLSSGDLLKNLILQMASQEAQDNLFMVVTCDRGKVLFVSKSSKDILHQDQHTLVGQSLFDILHKDDVTKVKEQISYFNLMPKEMLVDSKTLQPIRDIRREVFNQMQSQTNSTLQPGARRSFFCRMKSGRVLPPQREDNQRQASSGDSSKMNDHSSSTILLKNDSRGPSSSVCCQSISTATAKLTTKKSCKDNNSCSCDNGGDGWAKTTMTSKCANPSSNDSCARSKRRGRRLNEAERGLSATKSAPSSSAEPADSAGCTAAVNKCAERRPAVLHTESCGCAYGTSLKKSRPAVENRQKSLKQTHSSSRSDHLGTSTENFSPKQTNSSNYVKDPKSSISSIDVTSETSVRGICGPGGQACSGAYNGTGQDQDIGCDVSACSGNSDSGRKGASIATEPTNEVPSPSLASSSSSSSSSLSSSSSSMSSSLFSSPLSANKKSNDTAGCKCKTSSSRASGHSARANASKPTPNSRKQWRYIVMHCTGYLKAVILRSDEYDDDDFDERNYGDEDSDEDSNKSECSFGDSQFRTVNCLVAVCRRSVMDRDLKPNRPLTFTCRYSMEGKFTFVDQRTTVALGYTPQQLIGTSHYAYCNKDSVNTFKECHRQCILKSETVSSDIYQFKRANGQHLWLQTSLKSFRNPWTKFIDYIVANHTTAEGNDPRYNDGCVPTKFNQDMTGEGSQSSSPASSSSVLSPSVDSSKKSSSPSSSSIGSSYSMDSYASGANVQALLNQIDRIRSSGKQHSLGFYKQRSGGGDNRHHNHHHHNHNRAANSSGSSSSARKSNDDSGNYSDLQSCSSISSQNSGSSGAEYAQASVQNDGNFVETGRGMSAPTAGNLLVHPPHQSQSKQQQQKQSTSNVQTQTPQHLVTDDSNPSSDCLGSHYSFTPAQKEMDVYGEQQGYAPPQSTCRPPDCLPSKSSGSGDDNSNQQQVCGDSIGGYRESVFAVPSVENQCMNSDTFKGLAGPRMVTARLNRPPIKSTSAMRPLQRPYQYSYRIPQVKQSAQSYAQSHGWTDPGYSNNLSQHLHVSHIQPGHTNELAQARLNGQQGQPSYLMQHRQQQNHQSASHPHHQRQHPLVVINELQAHMTPIQGRAPKESFVAQISSTMPYLENIMPANSQPLSAPAATEAQYTSGPGMEHQMAHQGPKENSLGEQTSMGAMSMSAQQQANQQSEARPVEEKSIPMIWNAATDTNAHQPMCTLQATINHQTNNSRTGGVDCGMPVVAVGGGSGNLISMVDLVDNGSSNGMAPMGPGGHQQPIEQQNCEQNCLQCANHKGCLINQQIILNNSGDLNSMHLSSLAVDDLDEGELLECLAACDSEAQLYDIQSHNNYHQYNIYQEHQ